MDSFKISRFDTDVTNYKITLQYNIGLVKIYITDDGHYIAQEPKLSVDAEKIWSELMVSIHDSLPHDISSHTEIIPMLKKALEEESRKSNNFEKWVKEKEAIEYYLTRDLVGYSEIDVLIRDKNIEDILGVRWDKPITIVHNKFHKFILLKTNIIFNSEKQMSKLIQRISQKYSEPPTEISPITSFTNENNVRFSFTDFKTITPDGPTLSIRKPSINSITIYHLLKDGILTTLSAAYLWVMMDLKGFGIIIGAPSAGKTTLINAIFTMSNPNWHYFTIEDALELKLMQENVSRHQTDSNSSIQGEGKRNSSHGIFDLCRLSLRFRPDFVVVGEVLGQEAEGLFQVAAMGSGCVSSFHASDPEDALTRLESPPINISKTQTSLITYILHISWITRGNTRQRRILKITEPTQIPNDPNLQKKLKNVFKYKPELDKLIPDTVEELIRKSEKLKPAQIKLGIADMGKDLKTRMSILQKILDEDISDPEKISKEIFKYYEIK
ncbi:MAG: type II/IV secretion system ATPase subunit [Nitrosopumilus sp.]|nr:type II/IV secretion system ATPase subunit [Nitrosopumilus sp.]NRA06454.1 type II/IV secretion system ATPase subunit [Nitrosopumilus sp.]